jgi:hypothetical protein
MKLAGKLQGEAAAVLDGADQWVDVERQEEMKELWQVSCFRPFLRR